MRRDNEERPAFASHPSQGTLPGIDNSEADCEWERLRKNLENTG